MKKYAIYLYKILHLLLIAILFTACSEEMVLTPNDTDIDSSMQFEADWKSESDEKVQESLTDRLLREVPELNAIADFVAGQSNGRAYLTIQEYAPIDLWEIGTLYYPMYVGENWDDGHRVQGGYLVRMEHR